MKQLKTFMVFVSIIALLQIQSIKVYAESTPGIEVWKYSSGINSVLDLSYDEILNTYP